MSIQRKISSSSFAIFPLHLILPILTSYYLYFLGLPIQCKKNFFKVIAY